MKTFKQKIFKIALLCSIFFSLFSAQAQAPQKMSYQAVVRNAANTLITNTAVGVKISVIQTSANGTVVYSESHTPTTNANGLATFEIGGGAVLSGTFASINWSNGPYFIKTETDPTGGTNYTISGTSQLASVPYALFAANGGTPGPQGIQGIPGATGSQGLQGASGAIGATGKNTAALTTIELAGANCPTGGTKLQFGTDTNSNNILDVSEINASLTKYVCNGVQGTTGSQGLQGANGAQGIQGVAGATGLQGATGAQGLQGTQGVAGATGANGRNTLILTTTEPAGANCPTGGTRQQYGLDANGNNVLEPAEINSALTKYVCNGLAGATGATGAQGPPGTAANAWSLSGNTGSATNFIGTTDNTPLVIKTNNNQAMIVTPSGYTVFESSVAGPISDRLGVEGNALMIGAPVGNLDNGTLKIRNRGQVLQQLEDQQMNLDGEIIQTTRIDDQGSYAADLKINPLGGDVTFGAKIGVNTASTVLQNKLQIGNPPGFSGNDIAIGNGTQAMSLFQGTTASTFFTNTNFAFMPASGVGNVGIGTTAPQEKLEVVGNAKITGDNNVGGNANVTGNIQVTGGPDTGIYSTSTGSLNMVPIGIFRFDLSTNILNEIQGNVYNEVAAIIQSSTSTISPGLDDTVIFNFTLNPSLTAGYTKIMAIGNTGFDSPNYVRVARMTNDNSFVQVKYIIDNLIGFRLYSYGYVMVYGIK